MAARRSVHDGDGPDQAESGEARLENYANNSSPLDPSTPVQTPSDLRERRYDRRGLLWRESALPRVRKCGRTAVAAGGHVALRLRDGQAGFAGLCTCGSVWADPVCNAKIMARRAVEVGAAVALWQAVEGRQVAMVTLTMRHHRGQGLRELWDALSAAWGKVTSGKQWIKDQDRYGIAGWLRAVEVTWGRNGWHVHVHALLFLGSVAPPAQLQLAAGLATERTLAPLHARLFGRWARSLERTGLASPSMRGQHIKVLTGPADVALSEYLTKQTDRPRAIGLEVTYSQGKTARSSFKTETPWRLLDLVQEHGDANAMAGWHEWERGSKGRRQMTWAKGFRDAIGLGVQADDEAIAAEEMGSADDDLVLITAAGWARLVQVPADLARLLSAAESGGLSATRAFLDGRGVEYQQLLAAVA